MNYHGLVHKHPYLGIYMLDNGREVATYMYEKSETQGLLRVPSVLKGTVLPEIF